MVSANDVEKFISTTRSEPFQNIANVQELHTFSPEGKVDVGISHTHTRGKKKEDKN